MTSNRQHSKWQRQAKKTRIIVTKKKKRVPVPQKPPKVEKNPKAYDRDEEKKKIKKKIQEDLNSNGKTSVMPVL